MVNAPHFSRLPPLPFHSPSSPRRPSRHPHPPTLLLTDRWLLRRLILYAFVAIPGRQGWSPGGKAAAAEVKALIFLESGPQTFTLLGPKAQGEDEKKKREQREGEIGTITKRSDMLFRRYERVHLQNDKTKPLKSKKKRKREGENRATMKRHKGLGGGEREKRDRRPYRRGTHVLLGFFGRRELEEEGEDSGSPSLLHA
ncbi:hypothetical protein BHM03_00005288 [Ensete ventricosum]|nr:hypothetical protein BHM03_00005288 [Ensete ventricosum]